MSEYNQRQYRLMLEKLNAFERAKINLNRLANDLEGLLNVLEEISEWWKNAFIRDLVVLLETSAVAMEEGIEYFDDRASTCILESAGRLKLLVLEQINDPADHAEGSKLI